MANTDDETIETPTAFLTELAKSLKAREGEDVDLAKLVSQHILVTAPAKDCMEQALSAIKALAAQRANPTKENVDG